MELAPVELGGRDPDALACTANLSNDEVQRDRKAFDRGCGEAPVRGDVTKNLCDFSLLFDLTQMRGEQNGPGEDSARREAGNVRRERIYDTRKKIGKG